MLCTYTCGPPLIGEAASFRYGIAGTSFFCFGVNAEVETFEGETRFVPSGGEEVISCFGVLVALFALC